MVLFLFLVQCGIFQTKISSEDRENISTIQYGVLSFEGGKLWWRRALGGDREIPHTWGGSGSRAQGHPYSYRPCRRLGGAWLLEGHIEAVWARVVGVGGDGGWRWEGVEGGAGLCVRRGRRDAVLRVVCVVGASGRGAVLDLLVHAVQEPQVRVLWLQDTQKPPY